MDVLRLALVLSIVVICVVAATRPQQHSRGASRATANRVSKESGAALPVRPRTAVYFPRLSRNHWDRSDIARAVGGDFADIDSTLRWPGGTLTPRL